RLRASDTVRSYENAPRVCCSGTASCRSLPFCRRCSDGTSALPAALRLNGTPRSYDVARAATPRENVFDGAHRHVALPLFWRKSSFGAKPSSVRCSSATLRWFAPAIQLPSTRPFRSPCPPLCTSARSPVVVGAVTTLTTPATASEP